MKKQGAILSQIYISPRDWTAQIYALQYCYKCKKPIQNTSFEIISASKSYDKYVSKSQEKNWFDNEHRKLSSQTPERQRNIVANKQEKKNRTVQCLKSLNHQVPHSKNQKLLEAPAENQDKCEEIIQALRLHLQQGCKNEWIKLRDLLPYDCVDCKINDRYVENNSHYENPSLVSTSKIFTRGEFVKFHSPDDDVSNGLKENHREENLADEGNPAPLFWREESLDPDSVVNFSCIYTERHHLCRDPYKKHKLQALNRSPKREKSGDSSCGLAGGLRMYRALEERAVAVLLRWRRRTADAAP